MIGKSGLATLKTHICWQNPVAGGGCVPDSCRSKCIQGQSAGPGHMGTYLVLGRFVLRAELLSQVLLPLQLPVLAVLFSSFH